MSDKKGQVQTKEKEVYGPSILEELLELLQDKEDYKW